MKNLDGDQTKKVTGGATALGPFTLYYTNPDPSMHERPISQDDAANIVGAVIATVLSPDMNTYSNELFNIGFGQGIYNTSMEIIFPS